MSRKPIYKLSQVKEALTKSCGMLTKTKDILGCSRQTVYNYIDKYPELSDYIEDIEETKLDRAIEKLDELIEQGNVAAIIFFLKTKGKKRGFTESSQLDISSNGQNINTIQLVEITNTNTQSNAG